MRLIDADALTIAVEHMNFAQPFMEVARVIYGVTIEIANAPTIDAVEVVRGEWIKHKEKTVTNGKFIDFFPAEYECSNCGLREAHYFINSKPHNFCPNCGARMKGADDDGI